MTVVTRFNPSCNGGLHLGHAYNILVNERFAHSRGGQFYVRFDDFAGPEPYRVSDLGKIDRIKEQQIADIEWLGVSVDKWFSDRGFIPEIQAVWERHGFTQPDYLLEKPAAYVHMPRGWCAYPYQPWYTSMRAVIDGITGATHLIRGEELATDCSLQCWFCDQFGYPRPEFIFVPRLSGLDGDVSKTMGGNKIADFRASGYTPKDVRAMLAAACLAIPDFAWDLDNLKARPTIGR